MVHIHRELAAFQHLACSTAGMRTSTLLFMIAIAIYAPGPILFLHLRHTIAGRLGLSGKKAVRHMKPSGETILGAAFPTPSTSR